MPDDAVADAGVAAPAGPRGSFARLARGSGLIITTMPLPTSFGGESGWPHGAMVRENTLDAYVARLRRKLRQLEARLAIATVHGVGYKLE